MQVLPGENLSRRHHDRLKAGRVHHRDACRRHRRLARADISVQEAVHR
jgi:hypothetical protein